MKKTFIMGIATTAFVFAFVLDIQKTQANIFNLPDLSGLGQAAQLGIDRAICQNARSKFSAKIIWFDGARNIEYGKTQQVIERLNTISHESGNNGYDTYRLRTDMHNLQNIADKLQTDYSTARRLLVWAKNRDCFSNPTDDLIGMRDRTNLIRSGVTKMRDDVRDFKSYYRNVIREDLKAMKNQVYASD